MKEQRKSHQKKKSILKKSHKKSHKKKTKSPRKWSDKYKKSIDCNNPKGFSQRQHCLYGRK
jgi:hypothetical protein